MQITEFEATSALWKKIETELTEELQTLRERNDGDLTPQETNYVRGQIQQIKKTLGWTSNPIIVIAE